MITLQHWMWKRCSILSFIRYGYSQVCITKVLQGCIQFSNSWDQNGMKVRFDFRLCCRHAHNSAWILSASSLKYPRQHRACANWLRPYFDWRSNRLAYTALALSSAISVLVDPKLFTAEALPQRNVGPHRSGGSFWSGCPRASCHEKVAGLQLLLQLKKKDFLFCCRHAHNSAWILSASSLKYPRQNRVCTDWPRPYSTDTTWQSNQLVYTAWPTLNTATQNSVGPHRSGGGLWSGCPRASCHEKAAGLQSLLQ